MSQKRRRRVKPRTMENNFTTCTIGSEFVNVLKESNAQFNQSPQRKRIEKMARKNLQQLSCQEQSDTKFNVFEVKDQLTQIGRIYRDSEQRGISAWDDNEDTMDHDKHRTSLDYTELSIPIHTPVKPRPFTRATRSVKRRTETPSQLQEYQMTPMQMPIQVRYEPLMNRSAQPRQRIQNVKEELDRLTADRSRGWVECFRNNDRLLRIIGGMQSLIVVKGANKTANRSPSMVYIDSPLQCTAQPITSRLSLCRMRQIKTIQNHRARG